jgi:hypothetical protein
LPNSRLGGASDGAHPRIETHGQPTRNDAARGPLVRQSQPQARGPNGKWVSEGTAAAARALKLVEGDRSRFDALLKTYPKTYKLSELRIIASHFTGHKVVGRTKAEVIKVIHNWQREAELNEALHESQSRAGL